MTPPLELPEVADEILIVEDSSLYASTFRKVFSAQSWRYRIIPEGAAAWETLQRGLPKILLLDWELPGMDGLSICRRVRGLSAAGFVFVIMLTSKSRLEDVMSGFEAGADDYMTKPFEPGVLLAKVRVGLRIWDLEQRKLALIQNLESKNQTILRQTEELRTTQKQVVEVARRAGMAEIATSVLHNVGNLLNSAITSTTVIREILQASRIGTLGRLAELLQSRAGDFATFVQQDPRGRNLPEFMGQLRAVMGREHEAIQAKVRVLEESQDQIRQIIALQQSYAGLAGVEERIAVPLLLEDGTRLFTESFKRHDIDLRCDVAPDLPEVSIEKQKVLQILMNLLRNARDATKPVDREHRAIEIAARLTPEGMLAISVTDNGVGIRPEHATRIFNFGFTTKPDGHGFGLHSCANLARELGGRLTARSDGEGRGATFTLELPVT